MSRTREENAADMAYEEREKRYLVKWYIDIEAKNPAEAAKLALEMQRDKDSIASIFTMVDKDSGEAVCYDALEDVELPSDEPDNQGKTIVIVGNPIDGMSFYGPFLSPSHAISWAESNDDDMDWWHAALETPKDL